jgi:hypothetical protein
VVNCARISLARLQALERVCCCLQQVEYECLVF